MAKECNTISVLHMTPQTNIPELKSDMKMVDTQEISYLYPTHLREVLLEADVRCTYVAIQEAIRIWTILLLAQKAFTSLPGD